MLYRVKLVTTEYVTIEAESLSDAEVRQRALVGSIQADQHHGEKTTAELQVRVPVGNGESVWATVTG